MKKAILFLTLMCAFVATSFGDFEKSINLCNGKDLSGWQCYLKDKSVKCEDIFSVNDGVIWIKGNPFGYMRTQKKYANFYLHAEWCYPIKKTNSGIFLFVQDGDKVWPNAVECQLCDQKAGDFVLLGGSNVAEYKLPEGQTKRPAFPVVKKFENTYERQVGEWNSADIICKDGKITVFINGTLQNIGTSDNKIGYVALQSEGGDILFRNVKLTPIVK